jgi:hypothetical protein
MRRIARNVLKKLKLFHLLFFERRSETDNRWRHISLSSGRVVFLTRVREMAADTANSGQSPDAWRHNLSRTGRWCDACDVKIPQPLRFGPTLHNTNGLSGSRTRQHQSPPLDTIPSQFHPPPVLSQRSHLMSSSHLLDLRVSTSPNYFAFVPPPSYMYSPSQPPTTDTTWSVQAESPRSSSRDVSSGSFTDPSKF